jgi:hypothetical protein
MSLCLRHALVLKNGTRSLNLLAEWTVPGFVCQSLLGGSNNKTMKIASIPFYLISNVIDM